MTRQRSWPVRERGPLPFGWVGGGGGKGLATLWSIAKIKEQPARGGETVGLSCRIVRSFLSSFATTRAKTLAALTSRLLGSTAPNTSRLQKKGEGEGGGGVRDEPWTRRELAGRERKRIRRSLDGRDGDNDSTGRKSKTGRRAWWRCRGESCNAAQQGSPASSNRHAGKAGTGRVTQVPLRRSTDGDDESRLVLGESRPSPKVVGDIHRLCPRNVRCRLRSSKLVPRLRLPGSAGARLLRFPARYRGKSTNVRRYKRDKVRSRRSVRLWGSRGRPRSTARAAVDVNVDVDDGAPIQHR